MLLLCNNANLNPDQSESSSPSDQDSDMLWLKEPSSCSKHRGKENWMHKSSIQLCSLYEFGGESLPMSLAIPTEGHLKLSGQYIQTLKNFPSIKNGKRNESRGAKIDEKVTKMNEYDLIWFEYLRPFNDNWGLMDFSMAYSAQTEGSNPVARRICLAQGHRGKKVADSTRHRTRDLRVRKPARWPLGHGWVRVQMNKLNKQEML